MLRYLFNLIFKKKTSGIINISRLATDTQKSRPKVYKTSILGKQIIKSFEGLRLESYQCLAGVWTIGYGYTTKIVPGMRITIGKAEELLNEYLSHHDNDLNKILKNINLNQNQFDAVSSLVYNIGISAFNRSTLLKKLQAQDFLGAADEFIREDEAGNLRGFIFAGGKRVQGLINRRYKEKSLFLKQY